jgi:hypothetical protein
MGCEVGSEARMNPIPRSGVAAPQHLSIAEVIQLIRVPHESLRLAASKTRLVRPNLPHSVNLGQASWLLCISPWTTRELIRKKRIHGRQVISVKFIVWEIETDSVRQFAAERQEKYEKKKPLWETPFLDDILSYFPRL